MFKEGDIVRLKSGGPKMTVDAIHSNGRHGCAWFEGTDVKHDIFSANALELYPEEPTRAPGPAVDDPHDWMV